jgi:hypothetical protein
MKKLLIVSTMFALAAASAQAQGFIKFSNTSTTRVSTNMVVGGSITAPTAPVSTGLIYNYALYVSTTATAVNGQSTPIVGGASLNYAFNDTNWTLVAYGSNALQSGQFAGTPSSTVSVSGVAGGSPAQFVVIGWLASAGTSITSLKNWFNGGNPAFNSWIGQSAVSGAITLGTSSGATLFGTSAPEIPGFTLGLVTPAASVPPTITSQPADKTAVTGTSVTFSVGAYGTPAPACQWMFNSTNVIAGATSSSYTINNVQTNNAGTYSVVVTNTTGSTNSFAATLRVNAIDGNITFANTSTSVTKIYTNSAVDGTATGLTGAGGDLYYYALFASASATSVLGQTSPILGAASTNYAFNDPNWTLVAYGVNGTNRGCFSALGAVVFVPGISGGLPAQFVVVGWSANVGTSVSDAEGWFNGGSPASDGWIGQSAVSGAITLSASGALPVPPLFATNAPQLQGFTLGLASPTPHAAYAMPPAPPAIVQTAISGNLLQLSWPTASGSWGVQSAPSVFGPWSDTGTPVTVGDVNSTATVTNQGFYRLVAE